MLRVTQAGHEDGVDLMVFPELTLTGYSVEDLLMQDALLDAVEAALLQVVSGSVDLSPVILVGLPLRYRNRIYNVAVVVRRGRVLGWPRSPTCRPIGSSMKVGTSRPVTT